MADLAAVPEGWKLVPLKARAIQLREGQAALDCVPIDRCEQQALQVYEAMLAASPTPPSIGVTLPSEELVDEMGRAMWAVDDPNSPYEAHYYHPMARAILQLIERKTGRKG